MAAMTNEQTITKLYESFAQRDAAAMGECYADDAHFTDPVFGDLHGDEIGSMWAMLTSRAEDLTIRFSDIETDNDTGSAKWEAVYMYTPTSRRVHNRIRATFEFEDGLITRHVDSFDLWKWSRMAVGTLGMLFGWAPFFRSKLRETAKRGLDRYIEQQSAGE
jgi:ketosteroid isomerase-like protein